MLKHRYSPSAILAITVAMAAPACGAAYYERPVTSPRVADRAFDHGVNDGYDIGRDDARHHRRPEPERAARFRSADHYYDSHYGSRDDYRRIYRDGFRRATSMIQRYRR